MNPAFFGPPDEQLLGIHHPARGASRGVGVVLCSPAPMELARSHWAFRKLADQLSKVGFDVLRFDYRGTGDSNGELVDTTAQHWVADIKRATTELKDVAGVRKVALVGFRLGGLLAAAAASEGLSLEALVLWEPVVSTSNWLAQLELIDADVHREFFTVTRPEPDSVLGFLLPLELRRNWESLDLTSVPPCSVKTSVVVAQMTTQLDRLEHAWKAAGREAAWHVVASASGDGKGALLGNEALDKIAAVLGERR
jgi:pimeloyl-ACP methyl ester carboxylesterase